MTVVARSYCYAKQKDGFSLTLDDGGQRVTRWGEVLRRRTTRTVFDGIESYAHATLREGRPENVSTYPQLALETLQAKGQMHSKCP